MPHSRNIVGVAVESKQRRLHAPALLVVLVLACLACWCAGTPRAHAADGESRELPYQVADDPFEDAVHADIDDGAYEVKVILAGGSGKATLESPAECEVKDGRAVIRIVWSSPYYDYVAVGNKKYLPVNESGNSAFVVPVTAFDEPVAIIGDTTAMSQAHEVNYEMTVYRDTVAKRSSDSAAEPAQQTDWLMESWPWVVFAVCAVLSAACVAATVFLLHRYRKGQ